MKLVCKCRYVCIRDKNRKIKSQPQFALPLWLTSIVDATVLKRETIDVSIFLPGNIKLVYIFVELKFILCGFFICKKLCEIKITQF